MKFTTVILIASLCCVAVSANVFKKVIKKLTPSQETVECTLDEVSNIQTAVQTMPKSSGCGDKVIRKLFKRKDEIVKACVDIYNVYKNQCNKDAVPKCVMEIVKKGSKLLVVGVKLAHLLSKINDTPDLVACLVTSVKPYTKLLNKSIENVKACTKNKIPGKE